MSVETLLDEIALHPVALPPFVGALVSLGLFLYLLLAPTMPRRRLWFTAVALCSAIWSLMVAVLLSVSDVVVAEWAARSCLIAVALVPPPTLAFVSTLVRPRKSVPLWPILSSAAMVGALLWVPSLSAVVARPEHGFWFANTEALGLVVLSVTPPIVIALRILRIARRDAPRGRRRRQLTWSLIAVAVGVVGLVDLRGTRDPGLYPIAWAMQTLSSLAMYYAIARHRLLAIRTFFRRTAVSLAATAAAILVIALLMQLKPEITANQPLAVVGGVVLLFLATRAWVTRVEPALDALIDRRRSRIGRAWADFAKRSLGAQKPTDVEVLLGDTLRASLGVEMIALVPGEREIGTHEELLEAEGVLLTRDAAVLRDLLDDDEPGAKQLRRAFDHYGGDALVPFVRDGALLATAILRGEALAPADEWLEDELTRLGARAALALGNALLYDDVTRRSAGLETEVRQRTGELEEALAELRRAQAHLVESERSSSLGLLVAGVSHEINNALNFILANLPTLTRYVGECEAVLATGGVAQSLDAAALAEVRTELPRGIATISAATRRTRQIVGDLRRFARPETERRVLLVEEGIEAALSLLRRRIEGRIEVVRKYAGSFSVEGYPGPLNQCFFILLFDSIEAAQSTISVTIDRGGENAAAIDILIAHDGEKAIFEPARDDHAGRLRLIVARGIVERHGGAMESARRKEGTGEIVRVSLPVSAPRPMGDDQ